MPRIPVIIDCDPGHDDALALLLAFAGNKLDVQAVTVVGGNQTLDKTSVNALKLLSYANINVEVAAGCAKPLFRDLETAPEVHGESGLDGPVLPEATLKLSDKHAIDLIAQKIMECPDRMTIIATGPLTNLGLFLLRYPELKPRIERISLMGGMVRGGNWTPAAEFNIYVDPEAAKIVFDSGIPTTMIGLDVTHKAFLLKEDVERIRAIGNKTAVMAAELMDFYGRFHQRHGYEGAPLHDPVAVAWVLDPSIITSELLHVDVETKGEFTQGMTVVDTTGVTRKDPNTIVALDIEREKFVDMLVEAMRFYS